jgi:hypothetical protein
MGGGNAACGDARINDHVGQIPSGSGRSADRCRCLWRSESGAAFTLFAGQRRNGEKMLYDLVDDMKDTLNLGKFSITCHFLGIAFLVVFFVSGDAWYWGFIARFIALLIGIVSASVGLLTGWKFHKKRKLIRVQPGMVMTTAVYLFSMISVLVVFFGLLTLWIVVECHYRACTFIA